MTFIRLCVECGRVLGELELGPTLCDECADDYEHGVDDEWSFDEDDDLEPPK